MTARLYFSFHRPLGIIFPDGELWRSQRRFAVRALGRLGQAVPGLEARIAGEVGAACAELERLATLQPGNTVRLDNFFDLPCLNVIWGLVGGSRFQYRDMQLRQESVLTKKPRINLSFSLYYLTTLPPRQMIEHIDKFTMNPAVGPLVGVPYLKHIPPFNFIYSDIESHMDKFKGFISKFLAERKASFDRENLRGYVDQFLQEAAEQGA